LPGPLITGTSISATCVLISTFSGSGALPTNLNASNVSAGPLSISRGGTGAAALTANQILVSNGTTSILQYANLAWNNTSKLYKFLIYKWLGK
jgi:hypothetical protein